MDKLTEMLKGVLEGLVLEIISKKETYGYEITKTLNEMGFADIVEGTVYTILLRLEKNQLVEIEKKPSEKGPMRKFYRLNQQGQIELQHFWERWTFLTEKMANVKNQLEEK
ncbi:PadR family transcriptional regulator [Enterococcus timonensis]|uniref:PadR family transcriptional regulator n=1 Tax=Enterococcus timonensis TaxID=1852364 RepID=UPI0008DACC12|nr:PadR family transcriptional regulator [Enterococcus timonensis]